MLPVKQSAALIVLLIFLGLSTHSQNYYKTPSGRKYHLASCRMVKNVSEEITKAQVIELGLEPCKICQPAAVNASAGSEHKQQGQGQTVQCHGITRYGVRCRHMTRIANGYCFQHQPK
jgi:hypothetical protein